MELAPLALSYEALPSALLSLSVVLGCLATPDQPGREGGSGGQGDALDAPDTRWGVVGTFKASSVQLMWGPARSVGRSHRLAAGERLTTAQGVTPVQWRHVRTALVARSGQGCCLPRAAVGLGTPSLSGDCSTR